MGQRAHQVLGGLLGLLLLAATASARTMYATDTFEIVVRSEKQIAGRNIIKVLPSGVPLEVRDMDDTWAAVRLEDGRTGYVEKKHLIDREPYKTTAERLQGEVGQQRERLATLTQQLTTLRDEHQRLQQAQGMSEAQLQDLGQKYEQLRQDATTTQYLEITTKYTDLQRAHAEAQQQLAVVSEAYTSLNSSTRIGWFLSGAGVILMGWILGMASERWRGRRRRSAGSSYQLPH
jgi:SH3 domain protein